MWTIKMSLNDIHLRQSHALWVQNSSAASEIAMNIFSVYEITSMC